MAARWHQLSVTSVAPCSRLLALGLATGVVAQVFNTLGSLAGGGIAGSVLLIVVFAFGTVFNIAINALGAFVHSCRLQYVEFSVNSIRAAEDLSLHLKKNKNISRFSRRNIMTMLNNLLSGEFLALGGAALASLFAGIGSAKKCWYCR